MCVFCVYLLCIYKSTHIQYIFRKYLHVYIYIHIIYIIEKYINYIRIKYVSEIYIHVCVCIYIYIINIHRTHMGSTYKDISISLVKMRLEMIMKRPDSIQSVVPSPMVSGSFLFPGNVVNMAFWCLVSFSFIPNEISHWVAVLVQVLQVWIWLISFPVLSIVPCPLFMSHSTQTPPQ